MSSSRPVIFFQLYDKVLAHCQLDTCSFCEILLSFSEDFDHLLRVAS